jgi:hypothetical protein
MPLAGTAHEIYQLAQAQGCGDVDVAGVIDALRPAKDKNYVGFEGPALPSQGWPP